jgi:hypothetical protein
MSKEKYGFVYLWYDRKHKRFYIGCRWGREDDGYICSSTWMKQAHKHRPDDFKRRILSRVYTNRHDLLLEEHRWLSMTKDHELKNRYYNLTNYKNGHWTSNPDKLKTVGEKISKANKGRKQNFKDPIARGKAISEGKKGKPFSEEHRQKLREAKLGSKRPKEWCEAQSLRVKQQWASGKRLNYS